MSNRGGRVEETKSKIIAMSNIYFSYSEIEGNPNSPFIQKSSDKEILVIDERLLKVVTDDLKFFLKDLDDENITSNT